MTDPIPKTDVTRPDEEGGEGDRLLRLAASCPGCGTRPAIRVTGQLSRALAHLPAGERLATYQCHRRTCGTVYALTAAACHNAS